MHLRVLLHSPYSTKKLAPSLDYSVRLCRTYCNKEFVCLTCFTAMLPTSTLGRARGSTRKTLPPRRQVICVVRAVCSTGPQRHAMMCLRLYRKRILNIVYFNLAQQKSGHGPSMLKDQWYNAGWRERLRTFMRTTIYAFTRLSQERPKSCSSSKACASKPRHLSEPPYLFLLLCHSSDYGGVQSGHSHRACSAYKSGWMFWVWRGLWSWTCTFTASPCAMRLFVTTNETFSGISSR